MHSLRPYIEISRFHRPIGIWLVLAPAYWGLTLAYGGIPPLVDLVLFFLGAALIRGAGCTYNDLVDHKFDGQVERTKSRPLPANSLSRSQATSYLLIQLGTAALLLLVMNSLVFWMALGALGLILLYPWLKRITYWPQAFLGLAMNYSLLMAYAHVTGNFPLQPLILYAGAVLWTIAYDTIYAHQDKADDVLIGVKSSALALGKWTKAFVALFYGGFALSLGVTFSTLLASPLLVFSFLAPPTALLIWQWTSFKIDTPHTCHRAFISNKWVGLIIFIILCILTHFSLDSG